MGLPNYTLICIVGRIFSKVMGHRVSEIFTTTTSSSKLTFSLHVQALCVPKGRAKAIMTGAWSEMEMVPMDAVCRSSKVL